MTMKHSMEYEAESYIPKGDNLKLHRKPTATVAQSVEQLTCNEQVDGSNPSCGSQRLEEGEING